MAKKPKVEEGVKAQEAPVEETVEATPTAPLPEAPIGAVNPPDWNELSYEAFVASQTEGNFEPWNELSEVVKSMYSDSVHYVVSGNEPRTDFERVVARLLTEAK